MSLRRKARKMVADKIATTMTKVGEHHLHVELIKAGPVFWIKARLEDPLKMDENGMEFLSDERVTWSWKLTRKQAEELFCDLAQHLGYEIEGYERPLNTVVNAYQSFGKLFRISCYDANKGYSTVTISRSGAKRFVAPLAEEFEWDLTG